VKCWQIRRQTKAPQAAGTIHTDFERGFICAEVCSWFMLFDLHVFNKLVNFTFFNLNCPCPFLISKSINGLDAYLIFVGDCQKNLALRFLTFGFSGNDQVMKFDDLKELGSESAVKVCALNETLFVCLANPRGSGAVNEYSMLRYFFLNNCVELELDRVIVITRGNSKIAKRKLNEI
jgi:hypothetical protein